MVKNPILHAYGPVLQNVRIHLKKYPLKEIGRVRRIFIYFKGRVQTITKYNSVTWNFSKCQQLEHKVIVVKFSPTIEMLFY